MNSTCRSETGLQMYARLRGKPPIVMKTELYKSAQLRAGDIMELAGEAESGKTSMLIHAVCDIILQSRKSGNDSCSAPPPQEVVWIDTDNRFSVFRFVEIVEARLAGCFEGQEAETDENHEANVNAALRRFHYIKVLDSEQLLHVLDHLDEWIFAKRSVAALIIDSITAFYWLDRDSLDGSTGSVRTMHSRYVEQLHRLAVDHQMLVMVSRLVIKSNPGGDQAAASREEQDGQMVATRFRGFLDVMTLNWQRFVTIRFGMRRLAVGGLTECSIEKCGQKLKPETVRITQKGIEKLGV